MYRIAPRSYASFLKQLEADGNLVSVKGQDTLEVLNFHGVIKNPRDRLVINAKRKMNLPFGVLEWIGLITGEKRVSVFENYVKDYSKYSTDGKIVDGAYGARINASGVSQVDAIVKALTYDRASRQAVISIYSGQNDLMVPSKNTPCTLTLQFLIRDNKLNCITNMRSNDAVFGLTYDLFMFTMLHEYIAMLLDVKLGSYYHNAGSMHIYERHFGLADKMSTEKRYPFHMSEMPKLTRDHMATLNNVYEYPGSGQEWFENNVSTLPMYLSDFAYAARCFYFSVREKDPDAAKYSFSCISSSVIRKVMQPWLDGG